MEQPSIFADVHISVTEEIKEHLNNNGFDSAVIYNGIDCERFAPKKELSPQLTSVLSLSQSEELNLFIKDCCETIGVEFHSCNKFTDNLWEVEKKINEADLVIGIGRSLYDAMACGRCVISYDNRSYINQAIGDGYITEANIEKAIYHNCSGRGCKKTFSKEEFIAELRKYNPADGIWARNYALQHLNIANAAKQYLALHSLYNPALWQEKVKQKEYIYKQFSELRTQIETSKKELSSLQNNYTASIQKINELTPLLQKATLKRTKYLKTIRRLIWFIGISLFLLILILIIYIIP